MADFRKNNKDDDDGFIEKLVNIRRVVKVVKGGRIFGFSALVVTPTASNTLRIGPPAITPVPSDAGCI
jgi:small subunit ribosomal protein S5